MISALRYHEGSIAQCAPLDARDAGCIFGLFLAMPAFVVKLNDLRNQMRRWTFAITQPWLHAALHDTGLRVPERANDFGTLSVDAQRSGPSDVLVQGRIQTKIVVDCARCLGDAEVNVDVPMSIIMSPLALQSE